MEADLTICTGELCQLNTIVPCGTKIECRPLVCSSLEVDAFESVKVLKNISLNRRYVLTKSDLSEVRRIFIERISLSAIYLTISKHINFCCIDNKVNSLSGKYAVGTGLASHSGKCSLNNYGLKIVTILEYCVTNKVNNRRNGYCFKRCTTSHHLSSQEGYSVVKINICEVSTVHKHIARICCYAFGDSDACNTGFSECTCSN